MEVFEELKNEQKIVKDNQKTAENIEKQIQQEQTEILKIKFRSNQKG